MKKAISIIVALLWIIIAPAQGRFDWVQSWTGSGSYGLENMIVDSDMDSDGNIYVIGTFSSGAQIGTVEILPTATSSTVGVVIAKFSSEGDLLWHKPIHRKRSGNCTAYGIRVVGDTSIICMADFLLPNGANYSLHLLDTTYQNYQDLIGSDYSFALVQVTGFFILDTNGNLKDRHFLQIAYADSAGHILTSGDRSHYAPNTRVWDRPFARGLFNIDKHGLIYVCRPADDTFNYQDTLNPNVTARSISVEEGTIPLLKIFVDGQPLHTIYPDQNYNTWNHAILKFSPNFDSLYWCHYLFDADTSTHIFDELNPYYSMIHESTVTSLNFDSNDNFYVTYYCFRENPEQIVSDSIIIGLNGSDSLNYCLDFGGHYQSAIIAFNSNHQPQYIKQLSFEDDSSYRRYIFYSTNIDEESNSIFLLGNVCRGSHFGPRPNGHFMMDDIVLDLDENACWFRLDKTTGRMTSYGKARSDGATRLDQSNGSYWYHTFLGLIARNNRVITQVKWDNSISFLDSTIELSPTDHGIGLEIWDYDGNEISYIDFNSYSASKNIGGPMMLKDSILYLTGTVKADADLGDHHIYGSGAGRAFVAKYVDTAFMHPYVRPDLREEQSIIWEQELNFTLADSPVALTATATSGLPVSYSSSDTSIARIDGSTLHLLAGGSCTILATCPDNDYYQAAAPVTKTLTVGQSGIADPEASPLLIYPNPSRGYMNLYGPTDQINSIALYDMTGREVYHHTRTIFLNATPADQVPCYSLNISHLPQGSYIVKVSTADGQAQHLKLIKK